MGVRIEDYGLIGDCETAALVSGTARSIGCAGRVSTPARASRRCSGSRRTDAGGSHRRARPQITRRYRAGTLILETNFNTADGEVTLIDFMPLREQASHLVRLVVGSAARVAMRTELVIRFDYGQLVPMGEAHRERRSAAISGPDMLVLRTPVAAARGTADVGRGVHGRCGRDRPIRSDATRRPICRRPIPSTRKRLLRQTEQFWESGRALHKSTGPYATPSCAR